MTLMLPVASTTDHLRLTSLRQVWTTMALGYATPLRSHTPTRTESGDWGLWGKEAKLRRVNGRRRSTAGKVRRRLLVLLEARAV